MSKANSKRRAFNLFLKSLRSETVPIYQRVESTTVTLEFINGRHHINGINNYVIKGITRSNIAARGDGIIIDLTHGCKITIKGILFRLVVNQMSTITVNSYASDTRTVSYTSYLTIKRGKIIS